MPHIKIEYSDNLKDSIDGKAILSKLHSLLPLIGPFNQKDIKSRFTCQENFFIADGQDSLGFLHCEIMILSGRSIDIQKTLSQKVHEILVSELSEIEIKTSVTVDIREMCKDTYTKN